MKQALVFCHGLKFPHELAEQAIRWAKENSGSVSALFLVGRETEEQYAFPSDLDAAQDVTDKNDAQQDNMRVADSQMKLFEDMAASEDVPCITEVMIEPDIDEVLERTKGAAIIFADTDYNNPGPMPVTNFDFKNLIERLPRNSFHA